MPTSPSPTPAGHRLAAMASIHQAIGVLIDHGFSPTDAAGELHRRALYTGTSRHAAATRLLGDVHPGRGSAAGSRATVAHQANAHLYGPAGVNSVLGCCW